MKKEWWKNAVVYQIYPRSFQDSNNDGIGDLRGIIQRLPYLAKLGIDVLWLSPIYQSPNDDNGYDISDYQQILPEFGTMADFDELLRVAHQHDLKIMMDLVVNHTSDEHYWFQESKKGVDNPYRDFYIWRDSKEGEPPNNWGSEFGGSAWEFDEVTNQYYLHIFSKKQPDLNWENPKVREAIYGMMRWWLDKGVDGFRMDVINLISKDKSYPDDPLIKAGKRTTSLAMVANGAKVSDYLKEMNQEVLSKYPVITVGETPEVTIDNALEYAGYESKELQMVFQFEHADIENKDDGFGKWNADRFDLIKLKKILSKWQTGLYNKAWNSLYWNNHDRPRVVSRFGNDSPAFRNLSGKMLATVLHFMQGTPYIYQGEEIGMTNVSFETIEKYRDIDTINSYKEFVSEQRRLTSEKMMNFIHHSSRDNARTPMQWGNLKNAGFTEGTPWIDVNPNYKEINAEEALKDPNSIFYYYQKIIQLRKKHSIITYGDYQLIDPKDPEVFAYSRNYSGETLFVICNFTDKALERNYNLPVGKTLLVGNYSHDEFDSIRPYEAKVYLFAE
ncbi:MAG: glycoside hydrolase family 13 protein [Enterococcus casseliflavus]